MIRADVVEDAVNDLAHAFIEPVSGIRVNGTAGIFVPAIPNRIVRGEVFADGQQGFPLIVDQVSRLADCPAQYPAGFALGCGTNFMSSGLDHFG